MFNFAATLLFTVVGLLGLLIVYGAAYLILALAMLFRGRAPDPASVEDRGPVTVLIPAHHEGEGVVDAVRTLLEQDYRGMIRVRVLVADSTDESIPALKRTWKKKHGGPAHLLYKARNREVEIVECGLAPKREKLNLALGNIDQGYVAFLDADHRAAPDFISSALTTMARKRTRAVQ